MTVAHWENTVSHHFKMVLAAACALATRAREQVGSDHLLLAISYQNGPLWRAVLRDLNVDALAFRSGIELFVDAHSQAGRALPGPSGLLSPQAHAVFGQALTYGKERGGASVLNVGTVLLALANESKGRIAAILQECGIDVARFHREVERNLVRETDEL